MKRVIALFQHLIVIIGLEKCSVTLAEMMDHLFAGHTDIGKNANFNIAARNNKTMRVRGVVQFGEGRNKQFADTNGFKRCERLNQVIFQA